MRTDLDFASKSQAFLLANVYALIRNCGERPLLRTTAADGTPLSCTQDYTAGIKKKKRRRRGRKFAEIFNIQSMFVYPDYNDEFHFAALLTEPIGLLKKSAAAFWTYFARFCFWPRTFGHTGIFMDHYCFDRAQFDIMVRWISASAWLRYAHLFLPMKNQQCERAPAMILTIWGVYSARGRGTISVSRAEDFVEASLVCAGGTEYKIPL